MNVVSRVGPEPWRGVALETTLLLHGVPRGEGGRLAADLAGIVREAGGIPALVGVVGGVPTVGMDDQELGELLGAGEGGDEGGGEVPKANTANLGVLIHRGSHAATTVSTTMELATAAGVRVFATGGIGGVHLGYGTHLDISADLAAFTRFPVAVVTSGVKSILDVEGTREALETLGIPVVGYQTEEFPSFYMRGSRARVDARFDDLGELASFVARELDRTGRGVVVANPIPHEEEIEPRAWEGWLRAAKEEAERLGARGRGVTPTLLGVLHKVSGGATLRANLALVRSNARLAGGLASRFGSGRGG